MKISKTSNTLNIQIDNINAKQVQEIKYLGRIFTENESLNTEMETRCQKANVVT